MKNGRNAGITVFDHKEPFLKGINCNCMYVQQFFFKIILITFGTDLVCMYVAARQSAEVRGGKDAGER